MNKIQTAGLIETLSAARPGPVPLVLLAYLSTQDPAGLTTNLGGAASRLFAVKGESLADYWDYTPTESHRRVVDGGMRT